MDIDESPNDIVRLFGVQFGQNVDNDLEYVDIDDVPAVDTPDKNSNLCCIDPIDIVQQLYVMHDHIQPSKKDMKLLNKQRPAIWNKKPINLPEHRYSNLKRDSLDDYQIPYCGFGLVCVEDKTWNCEFCFPTDSDQKLDIWNEPLMMNQHINDHNNNFDNIHSTLVIDDVNDFNNENNNNNSRSNIVISNNVINNEMEIDLSESEDEIESDYLETFESDSHSDEPLNYPNHDILDIVSNPFEIMYQCQIHKDHFIKVYSIYQGYIPRLFTTGSINELVHGMRQHNIDYFRGKK